jgi:simple sugar transport system ATP-binding protein
VGDNQHDAASGGQGPTGTPLLALRGIRKAFPGTLANDDISFAVQPGEVHALLGENGAGKSTLVKIIYGVLRADAGEIRWQGEPVTIVGPAAARRLGIGMVFQHFSLFEAMTVLENVGLALDDERDMGKLRQRLIELSQTYGLPLDPDKHVHVLSVGERQRIEIVRCLLQHPKLLILDEPTSVLTPQEVEKLFETLRQLAREGCAILYISHKLHEVQALCDSATILRGGRVVATCNPKTETARSLAELMIGEKVQPPHREDGAAAGAARLVVDGLSLPAESEFGVALRDIALSVKAGEILGIAGIAGNGQGELMAALTGETVLPSRPEAITIDGLPVAHRGPTLRRAAGAVFVPEERNGHGAVPDMTLSENAFLTAFRRLKLARHGLIAEGPTEQYAGSIIGGFDVRTTGPAAEAGSLSGGNMQKFIVGREILQKPSLLVIAQPTWGVDAGAAAAIHQAILDQAAGGAAVLVISQDLDEIFALCDRVAVIAEGRLSQAQDIHSVTVEQIGILMGGLHDLDKAPTETGEAAHGD